MLHIGRHFGTIFVKIKTAAGGTAAVHLWLVRRGMVFMGLAMAYGYIVLQISGIFFM